MKNISINKKISSVYNEKIAIDDGGLTAISITARCKSRKQTNNDSDEDLRVEINGLQFRENQFKKRAQLFNTPASFNGSALKGATQTIVFLIVLEAGKHAISLIPKNSAYIESIGINNLSGFSDVLLSFNRQSEEGDRRPWYTFALIDLPLSLIAVDASVQRRKVDSDDIKIVIDGIIKKAQNSIKFRFWVFFGSFLGFIGAVQRRKQIFKESLETGVHYIEIFADRTPIIHSVRFIIEHNRTTNHAERASIIIKDHQSLINVVGAEFGVDPAIVGGVIYQEQSTNVDFIDTLFDYIGGVIGVNTSIGIGQVRVDTAKALEKNYKNLVSQSIDETPFDENRNRVARLKDPLINIRYVAAKLSFSQERWEESGYGIADRPDILGTLYNIEDVNEPIAPHKNPMANDFGRGVAKNFDMIKDLLHEE